jgi:hypothetical protein
MRRIRLTSGVRALHRPIRVIRERGTENSLKNQTRAQSADFRWSHMTTGCSLTPQMTLLPGSRFKLVELLGRSAVRSRR